MQLTLRSFIVSFVIASLFIGCQNTEEINCELIDFDCAGSVFSIEFIDQSSQQNLVSNGTIDPTKIVVLNNSSSESLDFGFNQTNNRMLIFTTDFLTGDYNLTITDYDGLNIQLIVDILRFEDECCVVSKYLDFEVLTADFEIADNNLVRILL